MKIQFLHGIAPLGLLAAGIAGCAAAPSVPVALLVPEGNALIKQLHATGVQEYQCQAKGNSGQFEWAFKQPQANLFTKGGKAFGKHYAGPTWEANDGSKVIGEGLGRAESPKPGSIPWLLLRAKATSGQGVFSGVHFVQRLNTAGGSAPTPTCRQDQAGVQLQVAYSADYLFYGVKY
jgi:Protein of unknown function (DUF3455)